MSYQVLARKYRPRTFDELVGQEQVTRALRHALEHNRLHHAYLFSGTRGVGKTTVARILARCLNCEQGISANPCGECNTCQAIDEGRFFDLIEVDAASRTGVDDTRELLENVQYAPTMGRFKVYLIDEVHMLSISSFNALLKTLEEPPPHVKFLLATTDPQKLPVTVLSRCLQFNMKMLPTELIAEHLAKLLQQETVAFEADALTLLGRAAAGSMRDALSLADQAIAFGDGQLNEAQVRSMLGSVDRDHVLKLLHALAAGKPAGLLEAVDEVFSFHPDAVTLLDDLISHLHQLSIQQIVPSRGDERLTELAGQFRPEQLQLFYDIALRGRNALVQANAGKSGLEMLLLRMLLFSPKGVLVEAPVPAAQAQPEAAPEKKPEAAVTEETVAVETHETATSSSESKVDEPTQTGDAPVASADVEVKAETETEAAPVDVAPTAAEAVTEPEAAAQEAEVVQEAPQGEQPAEEASELDDWWYDLLPRLRLIGGVLSLAANTRLQVRERHQWTLILSKSDEVWASRERQAELQQAISAYFDRNIALQWQFVETPGETPALRAKRERKERHEALRQSVVNDPIVINLQERFEATLVDESIHPVKEEVNHGF